MKKNFISLILLLVFVVSCGGNQEESLNNMNGIKQPTLEEPTVSGEVITGLIMYGGNNQNSAPSQTFTESLKVQYLEEGVPVQGKPVSFNLSSGPSLTFSQPSTVITDSNGVAEVFVTAGVLAGKAQITANCLGETVDFTLTVLDQTGNSITIYSGNNQSAVVGENVTNPLRVQVTDSITSNAKSGVIIRFEVMTNNGQLNSSVSQVDVTTDISGVASVFLKTGTTAGLNVVKATILSDITKTVNFNATSVVAANSEDVSTSVVTSSVATMNADGASIATLTFTANDQYGNQMSSGGKTVVFAPTAGTLIGSVTDHGNGTYTQQLRAPAAIGAGIISIGATIGGNALTSTAPTISLLAGAVDLNQSTITTASNDITANGSSTTLVTVTLKDSLGNQLTSGGDTVVISTTQGNLLGSVIDQGDGSYTQLLQSSITASTANITATVNAAALTDNASVVLSPGPFSPTNSIVTTTYGQLPPDNESTSTITVTLKDAFGNSITTGGETVTISTNKGSVSGTVVDNNNGTYTETFTSPALTGLATVTAFVGGVALSDNAEIFITSGAGGISTALSTVEIVGGTTSIAANGTSSVTVKVTLKDNNGNNLDYGGNTVLITTTAGTIGTVQDVGNGVYTAVLTSSNTAAANVTLNASFDAISLADSAIIDFYGALSIATSTLVGLPTSVIADGSSTSTLLLTLKDSNGVVIPVGGQTVTFNVDSGTGTLIGPYTDIGDGTHSHVIQAPGAANNTVVSATVGGVTITDTVTVNFFTATNLAGNTIDCSNIGTYENGPLYVNSGTLTINNPDASGPCTMNFTNIILENNAVLTHTAIGSGAVEYGMTFNAQTIQIDATSAIDVSSKGYYRAGDGKFRVPGPLGVSSKVASNSTQAGASHGGEGGSYDTTSTNKPNYTYGNPFHPAHAGASPSHNNSTHGGGRIKINVTGVIDNNGLIKADGEHFSNYYGGAGGSVYITTGVLRGIGKVTANGGGSGSSGAGGGGRVAIYYDSLEGNFSLPQNVITNVNSFGGTGGNANQHGAAGTVFVKQKNENLGSLIINNNDKTTNYAKTDIYIPAATIADTLNATTLTKTGQFGDRIINDFVYKDFYLDPNINQNATSTAGDNSYYKIASGNTNSVTVAVGSPSLVASFSNSHTHRLMMVVKNLEVTGAAKLSGSSRILVTEGDLSSANTNTAIVKGLPSSGLDFYQGNITYDLSDYPSEVIDASDISSESGDLTLKDGTFELAGNFVGAGLTLNNSTLTYTGRRAFHSINLSGALNLINNSSIVQTQTETTNAGDEYSIEINAASVDIGNGSFISATAKGYIPSTTNTCKVIGNQEINQATASYNGTSARYCGASHGGRGGCSNNYTPMEAYGNLFDPYWSGAACRDGDSTSAGGGIVRINTGLGAVVVNGTIEVNGGDGSNSTGAGGSIYINAGQISGAGLVSARGGDGAASSEPGSGGRIALYYNSLAGFSIATQVSARGGSSGAKGSAGTIYYKDKNSEDYGHLLITNTGATGASYTYNFTPIYVPETAPSATVNTTILTMDQYYTEYTKDSGYIAGFYINPDLNENDTISFSDDTIYKITNHSGAQLTTPTSMSSVATSGDTYQIIGRFDSVLVNGGSDLRVNFPFYTGSLSIDGANLTTKTKRTQLAAQITGPLTLSNSANWIQERTQTTASGEEYSLEIIAASANIAAGTSITAAEKGYYPATTNRCKVIGNLDFNQGTIAFDGTSARYCGGSHGGRAGCQNSAFKPQEVYGNLFDPYWSGASCRDGDSTTFGGGIVRLDLGSGNLVLNGSITTNAGDGGNSTGAGGSVYINAGEISGIGTIEARGGDNAASHESGSGGRIAIYYDSLNGFNITNQVTARGGNSSYPGSAGTIYYKDRGDDTYGHILFNNTGASGTLTTHSYSTIHAPPSNNSLSVSGTTLTLDQAYTDFSVNSGYLAGLYLNPDLNDNDTIHFSDDSLFKIENHSNANLTTALSMDSVASSSDKYQIIARFDTFKVIGGTNFQHNIPIFTDQLTLADSSMTSKIKRTELTAQVDGPIALTNSTWFQSRTQTAALGEEYSIELKAQNLNIDAGSIITAESKGYYPSTTSKCKIIGNQDLTQSIAGYNGGNARYCGASHGGRAGCQASNSYIPPEVYGSLFNPYWSGASCRDGDSTTVGGGIIRLDLSGNLVLNGALNASAGDGGYSTGAGGSVYINAGNISGTGTIEAEGGDSPASHEPGSGGRVALYYNDLTGFNIANQVSARGGFNATAAAAGTIYYMDKDDDTDGHLLIKNTGNTGSTTTVHTYTHLPTPSSNNDSTIASNILSTTGSHNEFNYETDHLVGYYINPDINDNGTQTLADDTLYKITDQDEGAFTVDGAISNASSGDTYKFVPRFDSLVVTGNSKLFVENTISAGSILFDDSFFHSKSKRTELALYTPGSLVFQNDSHVTQEVTQTNEGGDEYSIEFMSHGFTLSADSTINATNSGYTTTQNNTCRIIGNKEVSNSAGQGVYGLNAVYCSASHGGRGGCRYDSEGALEVYGSFANPYWSGASCRYRYQAYPGGGVVRINAGDGAINLSGTISADASYTGLETTQAGGSIYINGGALSGSGKLSANGSDHNNSNFGGGGGGGRIALYYTSLAGNFTSASIKNNVTAFGGKSTHRFDGAAGTVYLKDKNEKFGTLIVNNSDRDNSSSYATTKIVMPGHENPTAVGINSLTVGSAPVQYNQSSHHLEGLYIHPDVSENGTSTMNDDTLFNITQTSGTSIIVDPGVKPNAVGSTVNFDSLAGTGKTMRYIAAFENIEAAGYGRIEFDGDVFVRNGDFSSNDDISLNIGGGISTASGMAIEYEGITNMTFTNALMTISDDWNITGSLTLNNSTITAGKSNKTTPIINVSGKLTLSGTTIESKATTSDDEYYLFIQAGELEMDDQSSINATAKGYPWTNDNWFRSIGNILWRSSANGNHQASGSYGGRGSTYHVSHYSNEVYGNYAWPNELGTAGSDSTGGAGGGSIRLKVATDFIVNGTITANGSCGGSSCGSGGSVLIEAENLSGIGSISAEGAGANTNMGSGGGGRIAVYARTFADNFSYPLNLLSNISAAGGESTNNPTMKDGAAGSIYIFDTDDSTYGDLIYNNKNRTSSISWVKSYTRDTSTYNFSNLSGGGTVMTKVGDFGYMGNNNYALADKWKGYCVNVNPEAGGSDATAIYDDPLHIVNSSDDNTITTATDMSADVTGAKDFRMTMCLDNLEVMGGAAVEFTGGHILVMEGDVSSNDNTSFNQDGTITADMLDLNTVNSVTGNGSNSVSTFCHDSDSNGTGGDCI